MGGRADGWRASDCRVVASSSSLLLVLRFSVMSGFVVRSAKMSLARVERQAVQSKLFEGTNQFLWRPYNSVFTVWVLGTRPICKLMSSIYSRQANKSLVCILECFIAVPRVLIDVGGCMCGPTINWYDLLFVPENNKRNNISSTTYSLAFDRIQNIVCVF